MCLYVSVCVQGACAPVCMPVHMYVLVCMCVSVSQMSASALFLTWLQRPSSGLEAQRQAPLPSETSCWPLSLFSHGCLVGTWVLMLEKETF